VAYKTFTSAFLPASEVDVYLGQQAVIVCTSTTRPPEPPLGMRIWQTDTLSTHVWDGTTWMFLNGLSQFARKTVDESVISSTSIQDDDELFVPVVANAVYRVQTYVKYNSSTAARFRISWSGPSGATMRWGPFAPHLAQTNPDSVTLSMNAFNFITDIADVGGFGSDVVITPGGMLITAGSSGTLGFRWAQQTSTASNTTVRANSCLWAERVG